MMPHRRVTSGVSPRLLLVCLMLAWVGSISRFLHPWSTAL